ncbi:hypothetical protein [Psychroflexus torquis]|uniref:hypothetical protein n=1 Tax=Psychroflexus torquis TaxID=57029 RepID=UPI0000D5477E|nr:hypothetical protein [Psychroflexus torquis]
MKSRRKRNNLLRHYRSNLVLFRRQLEDISQLDAVEQLSEEKLLVVILSIQRLVESAIWFGTSFKIT